MLRFVLARAIAMAVFRARAGAAAGSACTGTIFTMPIRGFVLAVFLSNPCTLKPECLNPIVFLTKGFFFCIMILANTTGSEYLE
jgi:hypothetical protein